MYPNSNLLVADFRFREPIPP